MRTTDLTKYIENVYRTNPWYGFGLLESLGKLTEAQWHQTLGHRTVADIVGHLIAWRNFAIARLNDRTDFAIELHAITDWPDCSGRSRETLLQQLEDSQASLLANLKGMTDQQLDDHFPADYAYNKEDMVLGVMQHDVYHTGQINLLAALMAR
jgi:uncharacterized damage-inducible protein DinB